jgi:transposase
LFETLAIEWLKQASLAAVSRQLGLSWNAIDRIMQRAVQRGLERRAEVQPVHIGVDETSFRKRHDYVTVVSDQTGQTVLHVADDQGQDNRVGFYETLSEEQKAGIESVPMDMWPA